MMNSKSKKLKKLSELQRQRDDLENTVKLMNENNKNVTKEIVDMRQTMASQLRRAMQIRRRIGRRKRDASRIIDEIQNILGSYCNHLEFLIEEAHRECKLDWKLYESGEIEKFEDLIETFIDHRKDYHIYRIKASRLSHDLSLLENIPLGSDSDDSDR